MDKRTLRARMREARSAISAEQAARTAAHLAGRLRQLDVYIRARSVYLTCAFGSEMTTLPIEHMARDDRKRIALPRCRGREMRFVFVEPGDPIEAGFHGIPEPVNDVPVADDESALIVVPGLAFDRRGFRVGYGGGYYDRYLSAHPHCATVALLYGFQLVASACPDPHDRPVQILLVDGMDAPIFV